MSEPNDVNAQSENGPDPFAGPNWSGDRPFPGTGSPSRGEGRVRRTRSRRRRVAGVPIGRRRGSTSARRTQRRSPRRKLIVLASGVLGALVLLSLAWLVFSGLKARSELESVRSGVAKMRLQISAGDLDGARATAKSVKGHADDASLFTSGPVWALGSDIPYLGDPLDTARSLTSSVKMVSDQALPPLIDASDDLRPSKLRQADGTFNLEPIQALGPVMLKAGTTMKLALSDAKGSSGSTWLGPVNHARSQLVDQLTPLTGTVDNIGRVARVLPPILGVDGPKTYMISFENDAEIRGLGGIPGSFAVVTIDRGKVVKKIFHPDQYLETTSVSAGSLGPKYSNPKYNYLYGGSIADYLDSDQSPHFPYSAQIWANMWKKKTGQTLDGAMALDPTALSYLLSVSGPVTLPNGTQITSSNVVKLTQQTLYTLFPSGANNPGRKKYLQQIAMAVSNRLLGPGIDTAKLVKQGAKAATQHRLVFWSTNAPVETEMAALPLGGTLPTTKHPYVGVTLNNDGQSKLDYYLHASLKWQRTGCGSTRDVTVTLTLTNSAPAGLPPYVVGPVTPAGTSMYDVTVFGTTGGRFTTSSGTDAAGDSTPSITSASDEGHPVFKVSQIELAAGATKTLVFHEVDKQPTTGQVIVRSQPMVHAMGVTTQDSHC